MIYQFCIKMKEKIQQGEHRSLSSLCPSLTVVGYHMLGREVLGVGMLCLCHSGCKAPFSLPLGQRVEWASCCFCTLISAATRPYSYHPDSFSIRFPNPLFGLCGGGVVFFTLSFWHSSFLRAKPNTWAWPAPCLRLCFPESRCCSDRSLQQGGGLLLFW